MLKRLFDIGVSLAGLVILAPVFGVLALAIKLESSGPVFYRGVRVGRLGRTFRIYKFRTMVQDAESLGGSSTPIDDPRITRVGRILRKYKLDELPQLLNVLSGDMSVVGPRPQVAWAVELYKPNERDLIFTVRPGITDYASIRFRNEGEVLRGSSDPDKQYWEKIHPHKMRLSLEYVHKQSLWLDLEIVAKTLFVVAFGAKSDGE